jgi:DNA/RNA-binding domain of Phe-tRNA-synthetase-like protein
MLDSRQVEKSKVTSATTESFYILQGNALTSPEKLHQCAEYLIELTKRYCGGEEYYLYPKAE